MNEIDPSNSNGSVITENHPEASSNTTKSPLLSSLLSSPKHEITNGQQHKGAQLLMPTPTIVSKPHYDEVALMTKKDEQELINNHRKFNNLNDLLHRNNNNKASVSDSTAKSILENCLLKPSPVKDQRLESPQSNMDESNYHHHLGSPSTSSVLKFAHQEDSRKVEPLKINLNREPIRTVIKLPQSHPNENSIKIISTVSPTLSSSSSLSSESTENSNDNSNNQRPSLIQVIPKLHIRNLLDGSLNHEQSELHIVPKLTITGLNSPHSAINSTEQNSVKDHSVNCILDASPAIPKLTIKKDNNTSDYHLNNDANSTPKGHSKAKDGVKLTIKPISEPSVPKLTIKTKADNDAMIVAHSEHSEQQSTIPKLTIKASLETIPKITLKAVNNSATIQTFEKVVPKLVVKLSKECTTEEIKGSSSFISTTPSSPHVQKLNIKPIPPQEKEVPNQEDANSSSEVKFSMSRLIGSTEKSFHENDGFKPLEINTSSVIKNSDSGQDSPRIILKINKTNNELITSEIVPQPTQETVQKTSVKRGHVNDGSEDVAKKLKLAELKNNDVILINDSDTSSNDAPTKNHKQVVEIESTQKTEETKSSLSRKLRQSRRNNEMKAENNHSQPLKEEYKPIKDVDPLIIATSNSNSVDELVTPKRGRGRPKKIVEKPAVVIVNESLNDPLLDPSQDSNQESLGTVAPPESKKTPGRGRGRGRGRSKRTVEFVKNGKPIQITLEGHDDDDSPSFSLYNRSFNTARKSRGGRSGRGRDSKSSPFITPERSKDGPFMSPNEQNYQRRLFNTPSLYEEDTRMSIGGGDSSQITPFRSIDIQSCEESQNSLLSSASNTVEGSVKKRQKKTDGNETEGRTEFTIDLLAEYEWPHNEPASHRETFMVQEQIAEYLGVKSFKRKYPDLVRRPVDMEERNYLFESGLATEKMCDLGLTAVYASEVLDIMCNDYPEKYEEYKRYQREKAFRFARMRLETAVVDRSQMQKDKAISSASDWNTKFNKERRENRKSCMDLQNFLIQKPTPVRHYNTMPSVTHQSHYPIALVPGQFSEYYEKYTPLQLAYYPINTVLVDQKKLENYIAIHPNALDSSNDEESSDNNSSSSDSDSSDCESSSGDEYEDPKCKVCAKTPYTNQFNQPEKMIQCFTCKNQAHPSCVEMSARMFQRTLAYKWQCVNCKTCSKCRKAKDNKMLYCVQCDRGFHIYCLGLRNVPDVQYHCDNCNICSNCGTKSPEGHFNPSLTQQQRQDLAMIAQWHHEFTVNKLTNIREHVASRCLPCYRDLNEKQIGE